MFAIELFPCSGGMAEGFRRAGIAFAMAFDKDPDACDSYELNMGHRPIRMDVRDLLRMVRDGWSPTQVVDLVVADPPCTPWSRAGKRRGVDDRRDMLVHTCSLIAALRPRAYLIGNVPGLNDMPNWHHVQRHIGGLASFGYCVRDYAELDAAAYGVPQHRVRPFWYGHLDGPCLLWPESTHGEDMLALPGMGLKPYVTCRDALGHLPPDELGKPVRLRWKKVGVDHRPSEPSEPAKTITKNTHSDGCLITFNPKHKPASPASPAPTLGAKVRRQSAEVLEWPWNRPGTTVTPRAALAPPGHHSGSNMSGPNAVVLSEKAAAILQGFPETWVFSGETKRSRWSQLGQAMPPGLAEPVARAVLQQMRATASPMERAFG